MHDKQQHKRTTIDGQRIMLRNKIQPLITQENNDKPMS